MPRRSALSALLVTAALASAAACRSSSKESNAPSEAAPPPEAPGPRAVAVEAGAPETTEGSASGEALEGALFTRQVQGAFRVAACGGADAWLPPRLDRSLVDAHCASLTASYADYQREWLDLAAPFIAKLRPPGLPTKVVYPFGGGDLVSALATYPDATEITTVSLEIAGDVRAIDRTDNRHLGPELAQLREHLGKLFLKAHSRTVNLDIETRTAIPGEVAYTMAALVIHGYEPLTLRYFKLRPDGAIRWLTEGDIAKNTGPDREGPFANAEIRFRKPGSTETRVLRHLACDLSDESSTRSRAVFAHLEAKGKVAAMTKAASHLLWDDAHFSRIREYLMRHTDWMISDTTGVPPRVARKHGFVQDAYGAYDWPEPFGAVNNADAKAFQDLFRTATPIAFRYGYPDNKGHGHIVVTRKPAGLTRD